MTQLSTEGSYRDTDWAMTERTTVTSHFFLNFEAKHRVKNHPKEQKIRFVQIYSSVGT